MDEHQPIELPAGPDQTIVVYEPPDQGTEVDPGVIFEWVARDAAIRAERGEWIVSMAVMPLRHGGIAFGLQGSGIETKTAVAVVYGRLGKGASTTDR